MMKISAGVDDTHYRIKKQDADAWFYMAGAMPCEQLSDG
jgi:hypothetical protein